MEIVRCATDCFGLPGVCIMESAIFYWVFFFYSSLFKTLTYDRVEWAVRVTTETDVMEV